MIIEFNFPFHCSACDLNNAFVLSVIEDKDIDSAEKYVREDLPNVLKNKCSKKMSIAENAFIFGNNHARNPNTFCFTPGERILIRRISEYLKKDNLEQFAGQLDRENYNTDKTIPTTLGTIFGNADDLRADKQNAHITIDQPTLNATNTLLQKAKQKLKEFDAAAPVENLTEEMIFVDESDFSRIKGKVSCVYCENHIAKVSVKYTKTSYTWVMSNFTTHLKKCDKAIQAKEENENEAKSTPSPVEDEDVSIPSLVEDDDVLEIEYPMMNVELAEYQPLSNELKKQMHIQNMKMGNSIFQSNESKIEVEVSFSASAISALIDVCQIPPDGNCVFAAVTHQLYGAKIGSPEHQEKTHELRIKVVDYIRNNIPRYSFPLKGRIYEIYGKIEKNLLSERVDQYLNMLTKDGYWSGNESILAICDMLQKNMIIFNEKSAANMPINFDTSKKETIMLVFRLKNQTSENPSNTNRNHYDSVVAIHSDDILTETSNNLIKLQFEKSKEKPSMLVID